MIDITLKTPSGNFIINDNERDVVIIKQSFNKLLAIIILLGRGIEIAYLNVLNGISDNTIDVGIFAMENAQGGVVIESVEALAENKCKIVDMFYIEISQNLMAKENISLGEIEEVHSHEQALKQCKDYLAEKFWS